MRKKTWLSIMGGIAALALAITLVATSSAIAKENNNLMYTVKASNARLNRLVMDEPTEFVDGVPAEPVHSFVWDGVGSEPLKEASATLRIDPVTNTGTIKAEWTDSNGKWKFTQNVFSPPDHPSGLRLGPGASDTFFVIGDPVPVDVYLHGDTTAGGPVLPTVFNLIATWGPAEVKLNGQPFENPFDGAAPLWNAHTMTTVGPRDGDGKVRTVNGEIFDPTVDPSNGTVDYDDLEFHIVFHDAPGPENTTNFPPPFSFFYHLVFEDVRVDIGQSD